MAIAKKLGLEWRMPEETETVTTLQDDIFAVRRGTFVTLKIKDSLRGCIGSLTEMEFLPKSIERNAISAAFRDPRFPPLQPEEFDDIKIEVSVLTEPCPLHYNNASDLIAKLRVGIDGVIIKKGGHNATFLPQVWEQLPDPTGFLSHLCLKAGLSPEAWRIGDLIVSIYQVQHFSE
jgi:AmmeMemoRadiSam system protein A